MKKIILTGPIACGKSTTLNLLKKDFESVVEELNPKDPVVNDLIKQTYNDKKNNTVIQTYILFERLTKLIGSPNKTILDRGPLDPVVFNLLVNNNDNSKYYLSVLTELKKYFKNTLHIVFQLNPKINRERFLKRSRKNEVLNDVSLRIIDSFNGIMCRLLKVLELPFEVVYINENDEPNIVYKKTKEIIDYYFNEKKETLEDLILTDLTEEEFDEIYELKKGVKDERNS